MALDYARCYHQGIRVPDLDAAMAELGPALGVTWCEPQHRAQAVFVPGEGTSTIPLRFTYSAEGPQHVELLEGAPGTIWDGREHPGLHHVGLWSDDVGGETQALLDAGWTLRLAQREPADGFGFFTYVEPPSGVIVELVSTVVRPMFERWFAGGPLG
jgi:catechol 2,3-dioxygenase-like lactoylglutathione lyase family enzyme